MDKDEIRYDSLVKCNVTDDVYRIIEDYGQSVSIENVVNGDIELLSQEDLMLGYEVYENIN